MATMRGGDSISRTATTAGTTGGGSAGRPGRITQLGRYRIERQLGIGGSATVYLATDKTIDKKVALKVLHDHLRNDPVTIRRFANDARSLAKLNHPHITQVFSAELDQFYFAMEFVEGQDLGRLIAASGSLTPSRAIAIALQIADALTHIHAMGLIHRDVKPGNVLVAPGDRVKLTDFSVVQETDETVLTLKGSLVGTVEYMAPEQIREEDTDVRADVYALGTVLYEMLTGRPPFAREPGQTEMWPLMERILKTEARPPIDVDPHVPTALSDTVMRSLAKNPAERFSSMAAFAESLRAALGEMPTLRIVPVALSEPTETDGQIRLSWTESDSPDFERYEVHHSADRDFVPNTASLAVVIRDRTETTTTLPASVKGGTLYFRVKTFIHGGMGAVSNRTLIEIGKKPPIWRRREVQVLAAVAVFAAIGASFLARPAPPTGTGRARITGQFSAAQFQQTGAIQFSVANPEIQIVEPGSIASQIEGKAQGAMMVEVDREFVASLDKAGYDIGLLDPQKVVVEGVLSQTPGQDGGIVLHPADASAIQFEHPSPTPIEIPAAEWRSHEKKLVRITARVLATRNSGTSNHGYVELEGFHGQESIIIFRGVRAAFEGAGTKVDELTNRTVTVVGRPTNSPRYGWQIVLARPEHLTVR